MENTRQELARQSDMINLIYEGATNPSRWDRDIVPAIAEYMRTTHAVLFTAERSPKMGGFFFSHGWSQIRVERFLNYQFTDLPWIPVALQRGLVQSNSVFVGTDLLPTDKWVSSDVCVALQDSPADMTQMMTGIVFGLDAASFQHTALALYRSKDDPVFSRDDQLRLKLLLPHISRAIGVMHHLRTAELTVASTLASLDKLPTGILLLDAHGQVSFANRVAQQFLGQSDGLMLSSAIALGTLGRLEADSLPACNDIDAAIQTTLSLSPYDTPHFSKAVVVPHTSGSGCYTLQFSALGGHNEFGGGSSAYSAIVFIANSAMKPQIDHAVLQKIYGLTPTEAAMAVAFVEHGSAKKVAQALGTNHQTARTHLKRIYAKLGVDSRTRFIKAMLGLASA